MARRSVARLLGLDRSGAPPAQTRAGEPLRPWTIPNAIGFVRIALIPLFLVLAFTSSDGRDAAAATLFAVIGWGDYADGIAARVTGQYSRLGALMDPVTDRVLAISGAAVCWRFVCAAGGERPAHDGRVYPQKVSLSLRLRRAARARRADRCAHIAPWRAARARAPHRASLRRGDRG